MPLDFTPDEENILLSQIEKKNRRISAFQSTATPGMSDSVGKLYRANPDANPGAIIAAGQAVATGKMTFDQANAMLLDSQNIELTEATTPKKQGFLERNLFSKIKTGSRWAMAALNFVPQTVVGAAAQIFDKDDSVDGWFISTDFGSLLANQKEAGSGFFIGGRAQQLQAERARRYRGEIDGKAWTPGRAVATVFTQPGTREYNILSGFIDAGTAVAIPAAPGFQAAKGLAATELAKVGEIAQVGPLKNVGLFTKSAAGLLDAERAAIDIDKVRAWLPSRGGQQAIQKVAEINNIEDAIRAFPKVHDAQFWLDVVEADDAGKVQKLLLDNLGKGVDEFDLSNRGIVEGLAQRSSRVARMMADVPGRHLVLAGGNDRDVAASVSNLNDYLKLWAKSMPAGERQEIVSKYAQAIVRNGNKNPYDAIEQINTVTARVMREQGVPEQAIDQIMVTMKNRTDKDVHGALNQAGDTADHGATFEVDGELVSTPLATAGLESEMMKVLATTLPDPRKIRRLTSDFQWLFTKTNKQKPENFGDLKLPLAAIEALQNEIWRPITLMTPGYVFRNLTDSAFRLAFTPGLKGGPFHPVLWIQTAMYKRNRGDIAGRLWKATDEELADLAEGELRAGMDEFSDAQNQSFRELQGARGLYDRAVTNKVWNKASRTDPNRRQYVKGVMDQIALLGDDEMVKRLAKGFDNPEQAGQELVAYLRSDEGRPYLDQLERMWENVEVRNRSTQEIELRSIKFTERDPRTGEIVRDADGNLVMSGRNIDNYVQYLVKRLSYETANDKNLLAAVADGKFTALDGKQYAIFTRNKKGQRIGYTTEFSEYVDNLANDTNVALPEWTKFATEEIAFDDAGTGQTRIISRRMRETVDKFFSSVYPKRSAYLMQSPVFRQYYYQKVNNLIDELDQAGINTMKENLLKAAEKLGEKFDKNFVSRYVGDTRAEMLFDRGFGSRLYDRLASNEPAKGTVSLDQMDAYAKGFALDKTKELFYNASKKSNFADIYRVIVPFGSAWAEVMASWTKIATSNPEALRRVGIATQGVMNADPDADGKGFFYRDPTTGEYVFNYPFNNRLGPLASYFGGIGGLSGLALFGARGAAVGAIGGGLVGAGLQQMTGEAGETLAAPAKTLTMGFNVIPSLGPVAQIAASKVLGKLPAADDVRKLLTPYGEPELTIVPAWAQKVIAAVQDPENNRLLGDLKIETMRALAVNGEYDLTREDEKQRLEDDAEAKAKVLLVLRGLGQFTGPTRPDVDFRVETYAGDKFGSEMSKAFRDFQTANYDTAVENFLSTFGEDAFLYMASKTKAVAGGLDASTEFGQFERDNGDLFARYPTVAGYFATPGTNFDYQVFLRQIETGKRERVKPSELIDDAQAIVGKAIYRNVVKQVGAYPSSAQREFLSSVRNKLYARYPGFQTAPMTFNKLESTISEIGKAVSDPILDSNQIAQATRLYLDVRQQVLDEAAARGLKTLGGKKVADLRGYLRDVAEQIIARYPEFERLYSRVLFDEIDIDAGE
jgi:hypothetical protein